jgi:signal transduction histidine kinase
VLFSIPRQIFVRLGLLLAALFTIHLGILVALSLVERHAIRAILAEEREEHGRLIDGIFTMAGKPLQLFVEGYARRTIFTRPDEEKRSTAAESALNAGLHTYELAAAWIQEADGSLRIQITSEGTPPQPPLVPPAQLVRLQSRQVHFFLERAGTIYEVRGARLAANGTQPDAPRGWLFAATHWDRTRLETTALPVDARLTFVPPSQIGQAPPSAVTVRIERVLKDLAGQPTAALRLDCDPPEVELLHTTNRLGLFLVGAFGIVAVGLCGVCLWRWIAFPARVLRRSLADQDSRLLQPLLAGGGDLGRLAELVRDSMDARRQLEQTLEERARLGRDLHDGVIQTIFAAGMNVAGARSLIESNPALAAERLDRTCAALNAAVLDIRSFIRGLEPETQRNRTFRQNVELIYSLLRPIRPVELRTEIDDAVCARFTPEQRVHALQIVREAIANSLRHSTAAVITVRVQARSDDSVLEIEDDGSGFDPADANDGGHGLKNLATRAAEIEGTLAIEMVKPKGTSVRLTFSLSSGP